MGNEFAPVESLLEAALAAGLGSAISISIGDRDQERFRLSRGHCWRVPMPGPPIGDGAWFDLASLTKPMVTAALGMVFVDRGMLELGAPVRRWLPEFAPEGPPATVAQLLGHAAGCAPHVRFFERIARGELDGAATPRQALIAMASRQPLGYPPGQGTVYSDLGYLVLGHLLECVGEARLDQLYARFVAEPLGLGARFVDLEQGAPATLEPVVATELEEAGLVLGQVHDENARVGGGIFGHAGLFGRIEDVATFARAMLALGRGLVRPATATQFFDSSPGGGSWRLGWDTPSATLGISHAGDRWPRRGVIGHLGFTGTSLWLDLERGRWVALLSNRVHPSRDGSAEAIKQLRRAAMDAAWQILEQG